MRAPPVPIAVFLTSFGAGGTERQMLELVAPARPRAASRCTSPASTGGASGARRAEELADSVTEFPIRRFASPERRAPGGRVRPLVPADAPIALLQACDLYANIFALPAAAAAGVPVRLGSRRELNPDKSRATARAAPRLPPAPTASWPTPGWPRAAAARGLPAGRVVVIPNGIDVARFRPIARCGGVRRIGTVARLHPDKGHDVLVDAVALLQRDLPEIEATIVGDGPERAALESGSRGWGWPAACTWRGHHDDVAAVLRGWTRSCCPRGPRRSRTR